jgi:hypothetical protein
VIKVVLNCVVDDVFPTSFVVVEFCWLRLLQENLLKLFESSQSITHLYRLDFSRTGVEGVGPVE